MTTNVGTADRFLRISAGIIIIGLGIYYQSWWGAIGIIPLLTGSCRFCPVYLPLGMSTAKSDSAEAVTEQTPPDTGAVDTGDTDSESSGKSD